jgi:glycosyltransferase involved in cell wall biosynthesis
MTATPPIDAHVARPLATATDTQTPLLVAVEATRLRSEVRGIGRYVRALLPRLVSLRPGLRLALYVKNQRDAEELSAVLGQNPVLRDRVEVRLVRDMLRSGADVFWYPWNIARPTPARGAVVVTIHDVAPLTLPDPRLLKWRKNYRWRRRYAATARRATMIVADSAFTAEEVHRVLGVPRERMRVALLAADDFVAAPAASDASALAELDVRNPFVLVVGAADRRKNIALVERAMPRVLAEHPDAMLVLAGPRRHADQSSTDAPWRRTLGFVSDDELAALYRSAAVLVMPSTYEGFGLPVLEAMQLGTPVICTRGSSLPEVAGDAAAWVDPDDDARLATFICRILSDEHLKTAMRDASLAQSARFTWDETARRTIAAFEEAIEIAHTQPVQRSSLWRWG